MAPYIEEVSGIPSPFPGMGPFIESQVWGDFHHGLIEGIRESLTPHVRPRYVVRVEKRVYMGHYLSEEDDDFIRPDAIVLEGEWRETTSDGNTVTATATASAASPVLLTLPMPERKTEAFLTVRDRQTK